MANIALISIDDLRYDCLSHSKKKYSKAVDTPNLDKAARQGTYFDCCMSVASYTPAPHASMLTGLYPKRHGVKTFFYRLPWNISNLPEILSENDYEMVAWVEHPCFKSQGMLYSFEEVIEPLETDGINLYHFLESIEGDDNFLFLHLFDVHKPYFYATGGDERENEDYFPRIERMCNRHDISFGQLYCHASKEVFSLGGFDGFNSALKELAHTRAFDWLLRQELKARNVLFDEMIPLYVEGVNKFDRGRFKEIMKRLKDFEVVITSDHGEGKSGDDFVNITGVSEAGIHVPLILPTEGARRSDLVSPIDIMPTILDYLEIDPPKGLDGISLLGEIPERTTYADTWDYRGIDSNFMLGDRKPTSDFLAEACAMRGAAGALKKCVRGLDGMYIGDLELRPELEEYLKGYA